MKLFLMLTMIPAGQLQATTEEEVRQIWSSPAPYLAKIQKHLDAQDRDSVADKALANDLQTLAYAINQEIIAAESPGWATPTPERKAVIQQWADILTPHTSNLVNLALGKEFGKSEAAKQSRSLLDFAPPTSDLANKVRPFLKQSHWVAFAAADLLSNIRPN
jgi:delta 1-pyrroline-5-carboxylate dehydrogenase